MNLRSSFAKDIFADDLFSVYEKQTEHRNALRAQSREMIAGIVSRINNGTYDNPVVENKLLELAERLSKTRGKKQYGYLKADVKAIVNGIVSELASDERIAALYDLWYEQREEVIRTYTEELPDRIPLVDNPEFKPIKNAVIREALKILGGSSIDNKQDEQGDHNEKNESELIDRTFLENHSDLRQNVVLSTVRLFHYLSKMIQDQIDSGTQGTMKTTDRKLKRKIDEKKHAHGLKQG